MAVLPIIWEEDENSNGSCDYGQQELETAARSSAWYPALSYSLSLTLIQETIYIR